jgi:hypothetical protein
MNSKELRAIQEAYSQVYELDEAGTATGPRLTDAYDKPPYGDDLKSKPTKKGPKMKGVVRKEQADLYDIILSHLIDEGYADTEQAAEAIMVNMSEEWRGSIVEGIAGRAANAVGHQRAGTLGDDDEIRKNQDSTSASIGKMKRGSGAKITPTLPGV